MPRVVKGQVDAPERAVRLLVTLARAERRYARAVAVKLGLAPTDLFALGELLAGQPVGVVELGRRLGLSSAAATGLADRLEAAGHLRKEPHASDRRRVVLRATDSARRQLLGQLAALTDDAQIVAADFTRGELEVVERFIDAIVAHYEEHTRRLAVGP